MKRGLLVLGLVLLQLGARADEPVRESGRIGWHFYENPTPPAQPAPPPKPAPAQPLPLPSSRDIRPPELKTFEEMQRRMEEYRNIAIVNPSEENVRRYMVYERLVSEKASMFADAAQRVAWKYPELDSAVQGRPINPVAAQVYDEQVTANNSKRLAELSKDHVLLFFFRSDCPYCHAFAPLLARFRAKYGVQVEAVSLDGAGLPEFPSPRRNNGIAERLGVRQVPALFLAQPFKGEISTVGFGVMSAPELERRVITVADPTPAAGRPIDLAQVPTRP